MRVLTVVGARPQFVKAGPLSKELRRQVLEVLVHTGQHYDADMSARSSTRSGSDARLRPGRGSGSHGAQTGLMPGRLEEILERARPDCVLVYGDTNSPLAGALAAATLRIPIAHVEAGLRSFNR